MKKSAQKIRVILSLKKSEVAELQMRASAIYEGLLGSPALFPAASTMLPAFRRRIAALDEAEWLALGRARNAYAARDLAAGALLSVLESARGYVQVLCDASPEQAARLARAAGMYLAGTWARSKTVLSAALAVGSGAASLVAGAGPLEGATSKHTLCNWRGSPGGKAGLTDPRHLLRRRGRRAPRSG